MDADQFWTVIENTRSQASDPTDGEVVAAQAADVLPHIHAVAELRTVAHNEAVRGWPTTGALAIMLTSAVPLLSSPVPQHGEQALGVSGCHPA
jgi:hypothetical protein